MTVYRIPELKLPLDHDERAIRQKIARVLGTDPGNVVSFAIEKKSFDARDKADIRVVYGVRVVLDRPVRPGRGRGGRGRPGDRQAGAGFRLIGAAPGTPCAAATAVCAATGSGPDACYRFPAAQRELPDRPVIVGAGPAGLFCALLLAEHGYRPLVLERGDDVDTRMAAVSSFWATGTLDPESNMQFGEGGAGTFSDGKLNTTVNDRLGRNGKVIAEFLEAGAPPEIGIISKPHIGTDYLVRVVKTLRAKIESLGGEVRFRSRVSSLVMEGAGTDRRIVGVVVNGSETVSAGAVVLAVGHSARDTFEALAAGGIPMERKAFAIGVRIEHPQEMVSRNQFGESWRHPALPVADYKLTWRAADGRGVYSFCMCPGGQVVNASSEPGSVACNGMSDFARAGRNANSAIVVTVRPEDFDGADALGASACAANDALGGPSSGPAALDPRGTPACRPAGVLAGVTFQRTWERLAFLAGGSDMSLPVQTFADFRAGRPSTVLGGVIPDIRGRWRPGDLTRCLPPYVTAGIIEGITAFDRRIAGFARPDAILTGVETRTSSPVRIIRDGGCQSAIRGLYPAGEGAGYSGGIMSSAIDGIRVAEAIAAGCPLSE